MYYVRARINVCADQPPAQPYGTLTARIVHSSLDRRVAVSPRPEFYVALRLLCLPLSHAGVSPPRRFGLGLVNFGPRSTVAPPLAPPEPPTDHFGPSVVGSAVTPTHWAEAEGPKRTSVAGDGKWVPGAAAYVTGGRCDGWSPGDPGGPGSGSQEVRKSRK